LGGGFPGNQWNELVGEPSHGKTALALKTIAANQKLNPDYTTVWVAAEQWVPE
jgi:recombination protein RecA